MTTRGSAARLEWAVSEYWVIMAPEDSPPIQHLECDLVASAFSSAASNPQDGRSSNPPLSRPALTRSPFPSTLAAICVLIFLTQRGSGALLSIVRPRPFRRCG